MLAKRKILPQSRGEHSEFKKLCGLCSLAQSVAKGFEEFSR